MFALPIFTASHPATIVGANELNFCVRNGNRWTLIAINTNYLLVLLVHYSTAFALCQVLFSHSTLGGDPWESRTPVCGVRGRRLDHLTNGPVFGPPSRIRTGDPLIKSQLLYQLS